jgi:hypothetical protein
MKQLILAIALVLSLNGFAQYKISDTKKNVTATFWQYTTYSSYAGYLVRVTNNNLFPVTLHIQASEINADSTVTLQAGEMQVLQLGYEYVTAGNPYIIGLQFWIDVDETNSNFWIESDGYYITGQSSKRKL